MRKLSLGHKWLLDDDVFVIAEIGSNHMGDPDTCEKMIIEAAKCGADAVKLQKRNNEVMFTKTGYSMPYTNETSYGPTYGAHRDYLDWFGRYEFARFQGIAEKYGIILFSTAFEEESAGFLHRIKNPIYKIASCDVRNIPLVKKIAKFQKPMIISTGGASMADIERLTDAIDPINENYAILHCISSYPNTDEVLNLNIIPKLRYKYMDKLIGFSSHHPGILPLTIARSLGASIFEVHFTLNRGARGTDHGFSMEPRGLETICQDLKRVKIMQGKAVKDVLQEEKDGFIVKMGKSIYPARSLYTSAIIQEEDIAIKAPATGMQPYEIDDVIGHELLNDVSTDTAFRKEWLK